MAVEKQILIRCGCGRRTRKIPGENYGVCRFCQREDKICARPGCGKKLDEDACWSKVGLVCRSCARHYKPAKKCARCGKKTVRLSRALQEEGGGRPLCDTCRKKLVSANCFYCRKHRSVYKTDDNGRPVCKKCATTGAAPIICRGCGEVHPEFIAGRCYDCYCLDLALRRHADIRKELRQEWVQDLFDRFYDYEAERTPWKQHFSTAILQYGNFFKTIDDNVPEPAALTQRRVYEIFDPKALNHFSVPFRFLLHSGTIPGNEVERQAIIAELRRKRALAKLAGKWYEQDIHRFVEYMDLLHQRYKEAGHDKIHPRTIINNICEIAAFLDWLGTPEANDLYKIAAAKKTDEEWILPLPPCDVRDLRQIGAWHFKEYLKTYPRKEKSVPRFIRYLKHVVKLFRPFTLHDVLDWIEADKTGKPITKTPTRKKGRRWRGAKWTDTNVPTDKILLQREYQAHLANMEKVGKKNPREALICLFALLYVQKQKDLGELLVDDCSVDKDGFLCVKFGKEPAPLDPRAAKIFKGYLVQREETQKKRNDTENPYLFPGILPGSSIYIKTVDRYLRKHGLNVTKATVSGLYYNFHAGEAHPKIIADGLGVDPSTAIRYRKEAGGDARDELRAHLRAEKERQKTDRGEEEAE